MTMCSSSNKDSASLNSRNTILLLFNKIRILSNFKGCHNKGTSIVSRHGPPGFQGQVRAQYPFLRVYFVKWAQGRAELEPSWLRHRYPLNLDYVYRI